MRYRGMTSIALSILPLCVLACKKSGANSGLRTGDIVINKVTFASVRGGALLALDGHAWRTQPSTTQSAMPTMSNVVNVILVTPGGIVPEGTKGGTGPMPWVYSEQVLFPEEAKDVELVVKVDGRAGAVEVHGQRFDLANGRCIIARLDAGPRWTVEQVSGGGHSAGIPEAFKEELHRRYPATYGSN